MTDEGITLAITKRPAQLGQSINTRTEKHGDDHVPACDIPLLGVMLTAEEVDKLVPFFTAAHFDEGKGMKVPTFPQLEPARLVYKFEAAKVRIVLGVNGNGTAIELEDCKLSKLRLHPMAGGLTELRLTVQTVMPKHIERLLDRLSGEVSVEISDAQVAERNEKEKQGELPINNFGEGEAPAKEPARH
jgi:hypothetical protein